MIRLEVLGDPMTQGSKTAFVRGGRAVVVEGGNKGGRERHRSWREAVRSSAEDWWKANGQPAPLDEPVMVDIVVYLPRPKSAPKRVVLPATGLDTDKLARLIFDAISGVLIRDDARVTDLHIVKRFAIDRPTGASITVRPCAGDKPCLMPHEDVLYPDFCYLPWDHKGEHVFQAVRCEAVP